MADEDAGVRPRSPDRRWQSTAPGPAGGLDRSSRRRTWLFLLTALFLTLISAAIVWVLFLRLHSSDVFFLAIGIGEYNARGLPVNAFVEEDIKRLVQRFPKGMHDHPATNSEKLLRNELKELKDGLPPKAPPDARLVLYVSALALVRDDKVYVLPADADPDKKAQWIELQDIIDALKACPAKQKLLILDLAHDLVDPRWGVLTDRVAETLEDFLGKSQLPFPVLVSCSAGQTSLTSDLLQGSVFAYYLDQGLQGRADTSDSQTVTVKQLAHFVEENVDRWARVNRARRQQPRLFPRAFDDFPIVFLTSKPTEPTELKPAPYPEALANGWKERDRLLSEGAVQRAPVILQRAEANLLRHEDRWRRGAAPTKDDVRNFNSALIDVGRAMKMRSAPRRSLPLAGAKEDLDLAGAVARMLDAVDLNAAADKKDPAKAADELVKLLKAADDKKAEFPQQAWAVVQGLSQLEKIAPDHLLIADSTLTKLMDGLKEKPAFVEVVFVRRLAQFAKERNPPPESKNFKALLQTMRAHQAVIAALDREPEALPWVAGAVNDADQTRRQAEKAFFWREQPRSTWPAALEELKAARETYELAKRAADALENGRLQLDRAYASLPAYARLLCDWPEDDPPHQKDWDNAAEEATTLQAFFADEPMGAIRPTIALTMEPPARELKAYLDELERMLGKRIERAATGTTGKAQRQLLCLLANPLLKADVRADLLDKQRKLAVKLHEDAEGDNPPDQTAYPERVVAPMRARMSLALLRLTGIDVDPKILELAKKTQWNAGELATLERTLHEAWGRAFPDPWRTGISRPAADRVNRLRSPWDQQRKADLLDNDPTRRLQIHQREEFARWLRASYQAEIGFLEPAPQDQAARDFFVHAADEARP